jgi:hypothetical protein
MLTLLRQTRKKKENEKFKDFGADGGNDVTVVGMCANTTLLRFVDGQERDDSLRK